MPPAPTGLIPRWYWSWQRSSDKDGLPPPNLYYRVPVFLPESVWWGQGLAPGMKVVDREVFVTVDWIGRLRSVANGDRFLTSLFGN